MSNVPSNSSLEFKSNIRYLSGGKKLKTILDGVLLLRRLHFDLFIASNPPFSRRRYADIGFFSSPY